MHYIIVYAYEEVNLECWISSHEVDSKYAGEEVSPLTAPVTEQSAGIFALTAHISRGNSQSWLAAGSQSPVPVLHT